MKKILSLLLSVAIVLSCVSMVVFAVDGPQSENLLPAEISTFDEGGVTTHTNLSYLQGDHIYSTAIVSGALCANYYGYAAGWTSPQWHLGSYIREYAAANPATEYKLDVSIDVKGSINKACIWLRDCAITDRFTYDTKDLNADQYTTLAGSLTITSAEAAALLDTDYKLCIADIVRNGVLGGIYFDNITLKITPIGIEEAETPTNGNLLPAEISTFTTGVGVTSHANLSYLEESHMYSKGINDALIVNYYGYAAGWTSPQWHLGSYIREYAAANPASEYVVNVSLDVKGSINKACIWLRDCAEVDRFTFDTKDLNATEYTTLAGSLTITSAEAAALLDTSYKLCIADIVRNGVLGGIYFDNVTLTVTPVAEVTPEPTPVPTPAPQPIGLLPVEISTFENGVTSHASLAYLNEGHMYNKAVADGALRINYQTYAVNYTTPMWLLGSYIKNYATQNSSTKYLVEVSMDVKGSIDSANLAIRYAGSADTNDFVNLASATFNTDTYTTVSGSFTLTSAEALAADASWYALCLKDISRPGALAAIYFDNIAVNVTPIQSNAIEGATLDIGSTLTINYFADLDDEHKDAVLVVTRNDKTVEINGVYDETYGMYKFAYEGINPQCMTDNVSASLKLDGEEISAKAEYSVKDYFVNVYASTAAELGITDDKYTALIKLANDTLVFGAEAQKYMNYNLAELATDDVEWIGKDVTAITAPVEIFKSIKNTDANNKVASATLNMSNTVTVMYRVKLTDTGLTVKVDGTVAELVPAGNANEYFVYAPAATATEFNKPYTITITDGETEISKVSYSVNDYIAFVAAKGEGSALYDIVRALNNYGISAVAFKNA